MRPLFDFTAADGVGHTIWQLPNELNPQLIEAFAAVPNFYIADGHHRAKSASRSRQELRGANAAHNGNEEYNFFQCVLFPDDQLAILAYNRAVKDLNGLTPEALLEAIRYSFVVTEDANPVPSEHGNFAMYLEENGTD